MFDEKLTQQFAAELHAAEQSRVQGAHFSKRHPGMTIDGGYAVSRTWVAMKIAEGRSVRVHKIGLTARAMQQSSQIDEPDYGTLLEDIFFAPGEILLTRFIAPRVEVELAFVLKRRLTGAHLTIDDVLDATEYVLPGGRKLLPRKADLPCCGAILRQNGVVKETGLAGDEASAMGANAWRPARWCRPAHLPGQCRRSGAIFLMQTTAHWAALHSSLSDLFVVRFSESFRMQTPVNRFKQALANQQAQIGLWIGLPDAYSTEISAGAGFDWLLLDAEHAPNDIPMLMAQAQAVAGYPGTHAVARVPMGHGNVGQMLIKQFLDVGIQTLLVPMVDTAAQAIEVVNSMRYPQADGQGGLRGMGGARASRWGRHPSYPLEANAQVCLLVQAESRLALDNIEAIAAIEGVDGIFIGPADLSASLGHVGNSGHPEVHAAIENAIARIIKAGKAAGILTPDEALAKHYLSLGATFVAVGLDTNLLARHTTALAARFKPAAAASATAPKTAATTY